MAFLGREEIMTKIHYKLADDVAQITMDDGKANAMDWVFFDEMGETLERIEKEGAKVLIITGRPDCFSGGLDLNLVPSLSPTELNTFAESFARSMLRVFSLPVPTIAACTGHAVAGGAILAFSCDLRLIIEGPYLVQMNEMVMGIPLPSWLLLLCRSAIPRQWQMEALLHAKAYIPSEVVERGMFHGLYGHVDEMMAEARDRSENLKVLNLQAYDTTKKRMRGPEVEHALRLLKEELPAKED
jgi:enoyl-CoA hydratase